MTTSFLHIDAVGAVHTINPRPPCCEERLPGCFFQALRGMGSGSALARAAQAPPRAGLYGTTSLHARRVRADARLGRERAFAEDREEALHGVLADHERVRLTLLADL